MKEWADKEKQGIFGDNYYEETIAKLNESIEDMHDEEEKPDKL